MKRKRKPNIAAGKMNAHTLLAAIGMLLLIQAGWGTVPAAVAGPGESGLNGVMRLIGKNDAVLVTDNLGRSILSRHADQPLIPASTLKILTSLVAIHHLGLGYRFPIEFYTDGQYNLKIKGFGDPLLVSEEVADIAGELAGRLENINDIILDDSYFAQPLVIPGVSSSAEPYDAPQRSALRQLQHRKFQTHRWRIHQCRAADPPAAVRPATGEKIGPG